MSGKSSRVWSALSSTRFSLGLERAPPSTDAAVDPSPCTKLAGGTEDGMIGTMAKELPSVIWSRADFDRRRSRRSLLTNVICAVADVGRDLFHTLVVQHGLLFCESTGELLVDCSVRKETPGFRAGEALF